MTRELIVHGQNSCYVIPPEHMAASGQPHMQYLEQQVASSKTLEAGTYTIKITEGWYSYSGQKNQGEPLVVLWLFGHDEQPFVNLNTGVEVGTTWTTLNGFKDELKIQVKPNNKVTVCALFFDVEGQTSNSGEVKLAITNDSGVSQGILQVKPNNLWKLNAAKLAEIKQENFNYISLPKGEYKITIKSGEISYWGDQKKFSLEPWALLWIKGGKFIPEYPKQDSTYAVSESWCSLNGRGEQKDKITLKVLEDTTITGLFFDTLKEDNQGEIVLQIEEVALPKPEEVEAKSPVSPVLTKFPSWTWDSFPRSSADIVCVAPVRTIVRREEEITIIRRVRKVEEIDASPACPTNTTQVSSSEIEG